MDIGKPLDNATQRLFLALWPDAGVRGQLAAHTNQWVWPTGCVPYAPADWHVTLHFIGDVAANRVASIAGSAVVPLQPFELVLDQPRLWPHGLAVLGAAELPIPLRTLYDQLGDALRGLGLAVDVRPYQPHITLARHADAATPPTTSAPVRWRVGSFALASSTGDTEQRYQVIRQYR